MPTRMYVIPIPPGNTEALKSAFAEMEGAREQQCIDNRHVMGITREFVSLQETPQGDFLVAYLEGDATEVSEWGDLSLNANPDMVKARRRVPDLEQQQRTFRMPMGVTFDRANNRLLVCDTLRSRLQVYQKDDDYLDPQFNL